jgi:ribosomal protein S17E
MTVIQEGALQFIFDATVTASKYDSWSFYRSQFKDGCYQDNKAVDFLCYSNDNAWLVEVKDYLQNNQTKVPELPDKIAKKIRDSLAGLVAAQIRANQGDEKQFARKMLRTKNIRVVCHIEQPIKVSRLRPRAIEPDDLKDKLRRQLKAIDPHPIVTDAASKLSNLPWQVRRQSTAST